MQYIQLQQQPEGDIPNASISGSMNLFIDSGCISLKDENGVVLPQCGGGAVGGLQMELGWGSGTTLGVNGERVRLLNLNTNINSILTGDTGDEVWLFIERYKGTRHKHDNLGNNILDKAGWKHEAHPNENYPNRPSEIKLTAATNNNFYFGQEEYFTITYNNSGDYSKGGVILSRGLGKGKSHTGSYVYLRFKLKIGSDVSGWTYSEPLAKIKLMWEFQTNDSGIIWLPQLNYKYV